MARKLMAGGIAVALVAVLIGGLLTRQGSAAGPFPTVGTGPKIVVGGVTAVDATHISFTVSTVAGPTPADPMGGWNLDLRWDPAVFSFASATSQPAPGVSGFPAPTTTLTGGVVLGAVAFSPYTTLGLMTTVQLTVVAPGCSAIHLYTYGPPDNGGGTSALPADSGSFTLSGDGSSVQANQGYVDGTADNLGNTCTPPPTATPTSAATATFTAVPTNTAAPTATFTAVPTATFTAVPTATFTAVPTATFTAVPTATFTAVPTATFTAVPTATFTAVPTATFTAVPTATFTAVPTATFTAVPTATFTAVPTATFTAVPTATFTAVPTATFTAVPTATFTAVPTATFTAVPTATFTAVPTATNTPATTPTATPTPPACENFGQKLETIVNILRRLGSHQGDHRYKARYDLNHDGVINVDDLLLALDIPTCREHGKGHDHEHGHGDHGHHGDHGTVDD